MTQTDMLQSGWAAIVWLVTAIQVCIHSTGAVNNNKIQYAVNGSYANFTCTPKVRPSGYYWLINGQAAIGDHTVVQGMLEEVGYIFYTSDTQLMVSIPAREMTNNTAVRCRGLFDGYSNNTARLIVVYPTPPLAPLPLLTIEDHGSSTIIIIVRWFQPSLWSESDTNFNQVDYYNITLTLEGEHNEYIEEHAIINYTNATGSLNYTTTISSIECSQISIQISAVNQYGSSNQTLVTKSIPKSPGAFPPDGVEVLTYFDSRGTPVILINIKPPKLCNFQQFNYSVIIISDGSGSEVLRIGPKEGQSTDNVIQEVITSGLDRDAQYAARVEIETEQGNTISEDIAFRSNLLNTYPSYSSVTSTVTVSNKSESFVTGLIAIGCLSVFLFLFIVLTTAMIIGKCVSKLTFTPKTDPVYDEPSFPEPVYKQVNHSKTQVYDNSTFNVELINIHSPVQMEPTITAFEPCPAYQEMGKSC